MRAWLITGVDVLALLLLGSGLRWLFGEGPITTDDLALGVAMLALLGVNRLNYLSRTPSE